VNTKPRLPRPLVALSAGTVASLFLAACCLYSMPGLAAPQERNRSPAPTPSSEGSAVNESSDSKKAVATLAGGCFWCTEAVFERMIGVEDVVSGYIGGHVPDPSYNAVTTGTTGHAEAVQIHYDPTQTSFEDLLEVFFGTHDPTSLNRQGHDIGTQYRSAIFYHDEQQKEIAEAYIKQLNESPEFRRKPIVTTLEPATEFYEAEEYHQDYFRRNPNASYCQMVVHAKVLKFQRSFRDKVKR
jgi:peptide-methionine (S)-S-oxide reductase